MSERIIQTDTLVAIADAIRAKNGSSEVYTPAQMATAISNLSGGSSLPFTLGDIPSYVKDEATAVIEKVKAVQSQNTVTSIVWADAHHAGSQSSSWAAQTNISTLHAAMGMTIVAASCPIDFGVYCGDYTFGNGDTTYALFEEQTNEVNNYLNIAFSGIPAMYCVGNHDTGEYLVRSHPEASLYGVENLYKLIGSKNIDGTTVMGSTSYGYCYRDIPEKKIRIINLNTVEGETTGGIEGGQCSDTQLLWFAQVLYDIGASTDWGIIVVSHYPLDYGGTCQAGNIVYKYVTGGSVTYNNITINFSNHNLAKFVAQYHGHTHCLKVDRLYYVSNSQGTPFDAFRIATPSGIFFRNNEYAGKPLYGIDFGETTTYTKTANTGKDTAFVVNVYDPTKGLIHSFCYGAGYDRVVSIGSSAYYSIALNLSHAEASNLSTYIENGATYSNTLSTSIKYEISSVTVMMDNTDITSLVYDSSTQTITINNVTGNIIITVTTTAHVSYHNLVLTAVDSSGAIAPYENNKSINSSGVANTYNGYTLTGFIALADGLSDHIYHIGGDNITWDAVDSYNRIGWYDASFNNLKVIAADKIDSSVYFPSSVSETGDESVIAFTVLNSQGQVVSNVPANAAYFRIGAKGLGENLIVTLDEAINNDYDSGNLIDEFGYTNNKRISQTDGTEKDKTGSVAIGFIKLVDYVNNDKVAFRISGTQFIHHDSGSNWDDNAYVFYNASKGHTVGAYTTGTNTHDNVTVTVTSISDTDMTITITGLTASLINGAYSYLKLCGVGTGENTIIKAVS